MFARVFYIVNPASQNGATGRDWDKLAAHLPPAAEVAQTQDAGEAIKLAEQAAHAGADLVISVGGDGTLNEVVSGLMRVAPAQRPALGIVPRGTGGDFRKTLGYPHELSGVAVLLKRGRTRAVDVGRLTFVANDGQPGERHFINICSFGLGGLVDREVNRSSKRFGGALSFLLGSLKAMRQFKNVDIELALDDGPFIAQRVVLVAACNGRIFGGGMRAAPTADVSDGELEILTIGDLSERDKLLKMWRIYFARHLGSEGITYVSAKRLQARAEGEVLIDMDGEQPGRLPLEIAVVPGAVRFVC